MLDRLLLGAARALCRRMARWYPTAGDCSAEEASAFFDAALADAWRDRGRRGVLRVVAIAATDLTRVRTGRAPLPLTLARHSSFVQFFPDTPALASPRASLMDRLIGDFRYSLRTLRKTPAFTAVAVITLALGIGATTAVYAVVDGVLLRPFTYPFMDRLRADERSHRQRPGDVDLVAELRGLARAERGLRGNRRLPQHAAVAIVGGDSAERLNGSLVSASVFASMGIAPIAGRTFNDSDDAPGAARVAIISERVWRGRFGARSRHRRSAGHAQQPAVHDRRRHAGRHAISVAADRCLAAARSVRRRRFRATVARTRADGRRPPQARRRPRPRACVDVGGRGAAGRAVSGLEPRQRHRPRMPTTSSSSRTSGRCCGMLLGAVGMLLLIALLESCEPDARPRGEPPPRAGGAVGAGRESRSSDPAGADGVSDSGGGGRHARHRAGVSGCGRVRRTRSRRRCRESISSASTGGSSRSRSRSRA